MQATFHVITRTSEWTIDSDDCGSALEAFESAQAKVAAKLGLTMDDAQTLLASLELAGKVEEKLFKDGHEVDAADYL